VPLPAVFFENGSIAGTDSWEVRSASQPNKPIGKEAA